MHVSTEAPVTEHLDKVADVAYHCSGQGPVLDGWFGNEIPN